MVKKTYYKGLLLLISIFWMLTGCHYSVTDTSSPETVKVYFYNNAEARFSSETIPVELEKDTPNDKLINYIIEALYRGPQTTTVPTTNMNLHIQSIDTKERMVSIDFDSSYKELPVQDQIIIRASLVYSLTQLDFVDGVEFFIDGQPAKTSHGDRIGPVYHDDILANSINPKPPTTIQTITLYFANVDNTKLVKEEREIQTSESVPLQSYIIEELIKGPKTEGLLPTIPKEAKINDIKIKEGICQVDLSVDLKSKHFTTSMSREMMVYSIVNSLTEPVKQIPAEIQKVAVLIEGKKETDFTKEMDLSEFIERDERVIEKKN